MPGSSMPISRVQRKAEQYVNDNNIAEVLDVAFNEILKSKPYNPIPEIIKAIFKDIPLEDKKKLKEVWDIISKQPKIKWNDPAFKTPEPIETSKTRSVPREDSKQS